MVWAKARSGTWTDDFDGAEKVFYSMSQAFKRYHREHGSVYAICRIRIAHPLSTGPETLSEKLRQAWTWLRCDFPALTVFEEGGRKTYLEANAANIETWVNDTFWVDDEADAARDVVADLHLRRLPCLVFVPRSFEVLFHCSHWRIDALGACTVLDRLFDILFELARTKPESLQPPRWELEHEHLSASLEDAYGCAPMPTPSTEAKAEDVRRRNFDLSYPSAGLSYQGDQSTSPGKSQCQTVALERDASEQLIRACKARGFSVTAAVHAASAASVLADSDCDNYSTVVSVNLRPLLPGGASAYACGTYVTGITHSLRRSDNFETWCRQLTSGYRGDWDPAAYMDALRSIYRVHGETLASMAASGARPPASNVTVSSLGVIDKYLRPVHGAVEVETFHLGSAIMGRQPTLYIWTFRGRLTLSVDYNEAYYSVHQVSALLDSIRNCLGRELGVLI
ncbi:uncharacterized protein THITE_124062 [Thermothielavioides terrestris NRRL 8126]|jgi:hypothetical protein|uniref:Condensation domain-containing protein n=1 Tax=Thermothielavioides terrestris (strain ATCC 38088 / NRRL 8126) TaxID=578455 RepID=G2QX52_THETT|nr:uncharacterized protein THITE_124062 [Thermothielavioides terrestris NRRL 8126]AEO64819.1 hypothetical protein THITE_124062 [Thermothielavioides terrestris NRRL 8126]